MGEQFALAFLQDPTADACLQAVDEDGTPCKYCSLQGALNLCLTQEQADVGESSKDQEQDILDTSSDDAGAIKGPYDPTCALAFLSDPTPETCTSAIDQDGHACKYCTLQGAINLCLTEEQADLGQSLEIDCENEKNVAVEEETKDPYDPICALAYLAAPTAEACTASKDQDCCWCLWPLSFARWCRNGS
jgi:hypothetical protein